MHSTILRAIALAALLPPFFATAQTTDAQLAPQRTPLNVIWEVSPSPSDKMSTANRAEAALFPMDGQVYYLPAAATTTGQHPLYRLFGTHGDHMDAIAQPQAGYTTEGVLGYPWSSAGRPAGTSGMYDGYNGATGDHALMGTGLSFAGYTVQALANTYGYARYGSASPMLTLNGKQISVSSNLAAGGAVWSLTWNGQQFLDHSDYGRGLQSSLSFAGNGASSALPTEAGDQAVDLDVDYMHGSPLLSSANTLGATKKVQSTRAAPLEWNYTAYNGGAVDQPVVYAGWQLGKDLTLDDTSLNLGSANATLAQQVIQYSTVFVNGGNTALTSADIEIPTAYLLPAYNRGFTFDATQPNAALAAVEVPNTAYANIAAQVYHYQYNPAAGGVIYANAGLDHALGIYGATPALGGTAQYFTLWKFGTSIATPFVTKWSAGGGLTTLNPGTNTFRTYIVAGTFSQVCNAMRQLYLHGYR